MIWSVISYFLANSKPLQSNYHVQCVQMKNCQLQSGALLYITIRLKAPICTCCQMNQTSEKVFTFQSSLSITALNGFYNLCKSFGCSSGKLALAMRLLSINEAQKKCIRNSFNCQKMNKFNCIEMNPTVLKIFHSCSRVMPLISEQL